jgi:tetratricopeptide (TPR) repeat protein
LPDEAQQWFQRALTFPGVTSHQQSDILFSLAAVLFTQHRYDEARLYAQRASSLAGEDSALVSQSLMLIGDVLVKEQRYGAAEREYVRALRHAKESLADELHYRLGKVHYELGNREQAAELLLRLPLSSERLPSALRILARIAVQDGDYKRARELLTQGRERFPNAFLDSWVELTFLRAAIEDANAELVQKIREEAKKQYPVGDPWLVLLEAEAEGWLWHLRNAAPGAESL